MQLAAKSLDIVSNNKDSNRWTNNKVRTIEKSETFLGDTVYVFFVYVVCRTVVSGHLLFCVFVLTLLQIN